MGYIYINVSALSKKMPSTAAEVRFLHIFHKTWVEVVGSIPPPHKELFCHRERNCKLDRRKIHLIFLIIL